MIMLPSKQNPGGSAIGGICSGYNREDTILPGSIRSRTQEDQI
jgi:hypothetical protein